MNHTVLEIEKAVASKIEALQDKVNQLCDYQMKSEYVKAVRRINVVDPRLAADLKSLVDDYESMIKVDEDALVENITRKRTEIKEIVGEILECI